MTTKFWFPYVLYILYINTVVLTIHNLFVSIQYTPALSLCRNKQLRIQIQLSCTVGSDS